MLKHALHTYNYLGHLAGSGPGMNLEKDCMVLDDATRENHGVLKSIELPHAGAMNDATIQRMERNGSLALTMRNPRRRRRAAE